jgi:hypothetical protein
MIEKLTCHVYKLLMVRYIYMIDDSDVLIESTTWKY